MRSSGLSCGASISWAAKSIKELARATGLSRNTVRRALRSELPPSYERAPRLSVLEPFKPEIHRLLKDDPKLHGVRVRELLEPLGCTAGKTYQRHSEPIAEFDVFALSDRAAAHREFIAEVRMATQNGAKKTRVNGPWSEGIQFGVGEIYARVSTRVLHFQFVVNVSRPRHYRNGLAKALAAAAARRLA